MTFTRRMTLSISLAPIFLGILFLFYNQASRRTWMDNLTQSGVLALYYGGTITRDDLHNYFQNPPIGDSPIMRALEITPEDVSGLEEEDPEWLKSKPGQLLFSRMIKHIGLVKYLHSKTPVPDQSKISQDIQEYQESLMIELLEKDMAKIKPEVKQEEILAYYIEHPEEFHQTGKRYVRYLMLNQESNSDHQPTPSGITAKEITDRLESGDDFNSLISDIQLEGVSNAGDLGWLPKGTLVKGVDQVLWSLEVGEVTGPIALRNTIHFFHLIDEQSEGLMSLEQSSEPIQKQIADKKRSLLRSQMLGLSPKLFGDADSASSEEFRKALLQAAYTREWDQNSEVVKKTQAFTTYRQADAQFERRLDHLRRTKYATHTVESSWILENETAEALLKEMNFRLTVKLNVPLNENQDEM